LTHRFQSDLTIFDVPLPQGIDATVFYTTLLHTLIRGIMVAFQLDESEISGFLVPHSERPGESKIVLYENSLGGTGILAALKEPDRLKALVSRMRELLHEGDPEGGCEKACYDCLLSFYNQRDHGNIDRVVVLNWLKTLDNFEIISAQPRDDEKLAILLEQCQSDFERNVLKDISAKGIRMPDESQKTIYDNDGVPLAIADFFYTPKLIVFVDGSPHYQDYVRTADDRKRKRLKGLGYRMIVISADNAAKGIQQLAETIS
jgi:very-short-patch-repair endonuclease